MTRVLMAFVLACLLSAGASADSRPTGNEPLTADVMQAELFGIQMSGIEVRSGTRWSECVEPGGRTLYEIGGYRVEGVLEITADAQACFTYPESGTSCFRGQRAPKGYLFRSVDDGSLFRATKVERGVKRCISSELIG